MVVAETQERLSLTNSKGVQKNQIASKEVSMEGLNSAVHQQQSQYNEKSIKTFKDKKVDQNNEKVQVKKQISGLSSKPCEIDAVNETKTQLNQQQNQDIKQMENNQKSPSHVYNRLSSPNSKSVSKKNTNCPNSINETKSSKISASLNKTQSKKLISDQTSSKQLSDKKGDNNNNKVSTNYENNSNALIKQQNNSHTQSVGNQVNNYYKQSQQLQSNKQNAGVGNSTFYSKLKSANQSKNLTINTNEVNKNYNNVTMYSQDHRHDRNNSDGIAIQQSSSIAPISLIQNVINTVPVMIQQPMTTKHGLKKIQSFQKDCLLTEDQSLIQKTNKPRLYPTKQLSTGGASFSSTNSRIFGGIRPRNPADVSVSSKGSLDSIASGNKTQQLFGNKFKGSQPQLATVQTVQLRILENSKLSNSPVKNQNKLILNQSECQQTYSEKKNIKLQHASSQISQISALISPKQSVISTQKIGSQYATNKKLVVFKSTDKKNQINSLSSSGYLQPKLSNMNENGFENNVQHKGDKKISSIKQQSLSGFIGQSKQLLQESQDDDFGPTDDQNEHYQTGTIQQSQFLKDIEEQQLDDSGEGDHVSKTQKLQQRSQESLNAINIQSNGTIEKNTTMQNSVSQQQLPKPINFVALNQVNSQGALGLDKIKDNLIGVSAATDTFSLTQKQRFSQQSSSQYAGVPIKKNRNSTSTITDLDNDKDAKQKITSSKVGSIKNQLKQQIQNQQLFSKVHNKNPLNLTIFNDHTGETQNQISPVTKKNNHSQQISQINSTQLQILSNPQQPSSQMGQAIELPMSGRQALIHFNSVLTEYEKIEIQSYRLVYFVGNTQAKKLQGSQNKQNNFGYDDERGDYNIVINDHLAYRFEVIDRLGSGSFGQAIKCFDHKIQQMVAVKVIRNKKRFQHQAGIELKILKLLNDKDKQDENNIIRMLDYDVFRKHLIISFEILSMNLYEFIKANNFQGVSLGLVRRFAIQILQALKFQRDLNIIHCDLKPENILLKQPNKSGIKIIDYGSSCMQNQRIYTYIQSRFYRAPEIILGIPYTSAIDVWSFGCILAELYSGYPLFPGENEQDQLSYIMQIKDVPDKALIEIATRKNLFFDPKDNSPIIVANSRGRKRKPNSRTLSQILNNCTDQLFLDFLEKCLDWNPISRITPLEALQHEWILSGLPQKVLIHHKQIFQGVDSRIQLRDATFSEIQGFPEDANQKTISDIVKELKRTKSNNALLFAVEEITDNRYNSPPPPPSVAAALAALKQSSDNKIQTSKNQPVELQHSISLQPISKTIDLTESNIGQIAQGNLIKSQVIEQPINEEALKSNNSEIDQQLNIKLRIQNADDDDQYCVISPRIENTSGDKKLNDSAQNKGILNAISLKTDKEVNSQQNEDRGHLEIKSQLMNTQSLSVDKKLLIDNEVEDDEDDALMDIEDDEGVTQKLSTQRVPSSLIKNLDKTPSKKNQMFDDQSKQLGRVSNSMASYQLSQKQDNNDSQINSEFLQVFRPAQLSNQQSAITSYMKQVQNQKKSVKSLQNQNHMPIKLKLNSNSVQQQKITNDLGKKQAAVTEISVDLNYSNQIQVSGDSSNAGCIKKNQTHEEIYYINN